MSNYNRALFYISEGNANGVVTGTYLLTRTRQSAGPQFNPLTGQAWIRVITAQNIDTQATISIGTNSPNFNNIVNSQTVNGPAGTYNIPNASFAQPLGALPVDTDIFINVTTAATGTNPVLNFRVAVAGLDL